MIRMRLGAAHLHLIDRRHMVALFMLFLFASPVALATDRGEDAFLTGYVSSVLERDFHWERNSYLLKVVDGYARITLLEDDPSGREAVDAQLRAIDGVRGVEVLVQSAAMAKPGNFRRLLGLAVETEAFPTGDLFQPLIADPKQPQFFVSLKRFRSPDIEYTMAAVGFGETFGMYKFLGSREGDGMQLGLEGAIFAQFNMSTPSSDLMNADYTIGVPVTYRHGSNSLRFRVYHQSSHLGDELLQGANPPKRVNLSYEAVELICSREWREWRAYVGGEYMFAREPDDLKPASAHWGVEYRGSKPLLGHGRLIGGLDMKKLEEHDWSVDTSVKAGLEFGHPNPGQRRLRLLAEWYKGLDPHGQFFANKVEYLGMGISLGF